MNRRCQLFRNGLRLWTLILVGSLFSHHADAFDPYTDRGVDRQQQLEAGARKEGKVLFYSGWVANQILAPMKAAFERKYPFVELQYQEGNGRSHVQKIINESRANARNGDIVSGTGLAEPLIKAGMIQPYFSPSSETYPAVYKSPEGYYTSANVNYYGVAYNTRTVKAEDAPRTFADLLDPKWRGKMAWPASSDSGALLFVGSILSSMGPEAGENYLIQLSQNRVVNYAGSARAMVDQVGQGEYQLGLNSFAHHPIISQMLGAPLELSLLEPVPVDINTLMAIKRAPHPHASVLLIDFILSIEGQTLLRDAGSFTTHPSLEPIAEMRKAIPTLNNKTINVFTPEAAFKVRDQSLALISRWFK